MRPIAQAGRSKALFGEEAAMIYAGGLKCQCTGLLTYPPPGRRRHATLWSSMASVERPRLPDSVAESRFKKSRDKWTEVETKHM